MLSWCPRWGWAALNLGGLPSELDIWTQSKRKSVCRVVSEWSIWVWKRGWGQINHFPLSAFVALLNYRYEESKHIKIPPLLWLFVCFTSSWKDSAKAFNVKFHWVVTRKTLLNIQTESHMSNFPHSSILFILNRPSAMLPWVWFSFKLTDQLQVGVANCSIGPGICNHVRVPKYSQDPPPNSSHNLHN